jgi:hypothetical protein
MSVQDELREWKGKCMNLEGASHPPSLWILIRKTWRISKFSSQQAKLLNLWNRVPDRWLSRISSHVIFNWSILSIFSWTNKSIKSFQEIDTRSSCNHHSNFTGISKRLVVNIGLKHLGEEAGTRRQTNSLNKTIAEENLSLII